MHGLISESLSPFGGTQVPAKIVIAGGAGNVVSGLRAACSGSSLVAIGFGSAHLVESNFIDSGYVGGFGCRDVVVRGNTFVGSPNNALGFAGFSHAPCARNSYLHNVIWNHGRIAIEDHSPDAPEFNTNTVIRGNIVGKPAAATTSGTAISAVGADAIIDANAIQDATGYAIEAGGIGTQVTRNHIAWTTAVTTNPPAIAVNSSTPDAPPARVGENVIRNSSVAIVLYANPLLRAVTISDNEIIDAATTGIDLASPGGTITEVTCSGNRIYFTRALAAQAGARIGIKTTTGAVLANNYVQYSAGAASASADNPIAFVGNGVTLDGNVVDGGDALRDAVMCRALGASWSGWKLQSNRFVHGAIANVAALASPALRSNTGVIGTR